MRHMCMSFLSFYMDDCFSPQTGIAPGYGEGIKVLRMFQMKNEIVKHQTSGAN